jgi:hypothetical protein
MRSPKRCPRLGLLLPALLLTAAGCGGKGKPVKVEGFVTLDDKPLPGATVTFAPVGEGRPASGRTDADGSFRLTTFRSDDGALPGEYKVIVVMGEITEEQFVGRDPETLSKEEKLKARMKMSPQGRKETARNKQKSASTVPAIYSDVKRTPLKEVVPPDGRVELALRSGAR